MEAGKEAASFVEAMTKSRVRQCAEDRAARKSEEGQAKQRQAILGKLKNLATGLSLEALREFRDQVDQILGGHLSWNSDARYNGCNRRSFGKAFPIQSWDWNFRPGCPRKSGHPHRFSPKTSQS
jgi:hypothetical protein